MTTEDKEMRDAFDAWSNEDIPMFHGSLKHRDVNMLTSEVFCAGYAASAANSAKRIAKLKQERGELAAQLKLISAAVYAAEIHRGMIRIREAFSITPSAALREIEARVLEEAATYACTTEIKEYCLEMAAAKRKEG